MTLPWRARRDQADLADAERGQHMPGRTRHARMAHVADDGDLEAVELFLRLHAEMIRSPPRTRKGVLFCQADGRVGAVRHHVDVVHLYDQPVGASFLLRHDPGAASKESGQSPLD